MMPFVDADAAGPHADSTGTLTVTWWRYGDGTTCVTCDNPHIRVVSVPREADDRRLEPDEAYVRAQERRERHAALQRLRGAVMQGDRVRYWPMAAADVPPGPQVAGHRCMGYFAGCRDWTRGRHWDRRSRYGER